MDFTAFENDVDALLVTAATLAGLQVFDSPADARKSARELSQAKANGKPSTISRTLPEGPLSGEEANDRALTMILAGDTVGAERLMKRHRANRG